jgi:endonuclease G
MPDAEPFIEARPSDYVDRRGYDPAFLETPVALPRLVDTADVLAFEWDGRTEHELCYEHFSVVMSRSRRLCFFSAVNIDGREPHRLKRPAWRLDPRIPAAQQIRQECYGAEPKFSRGHMTRREDPIWGTTAAAALGNGDSMHVTNTVPQMQPFNAGIWLGLEDYALDHAREDDMRISVFTGPFLFDDDPVRFGVKIPRSFWKVIAFIHDETGELCATGYTMSQDDFIREEEFVFGQHLTWQTPIRSIEQRAGVRFANLATLDPLRDVEEGVGSVLVDFAGIVFRR